MCVTVNISLHYINANRYDGIGGLWQSYIDTFFFSPLFARTHTRTSLSSQLSDLTDSHIRYKKNQFSYFSFTFRLLYFAPLWLYTFIRFS